MVQELTAPPTGRMVVGLTGCFGSGKTTVAHLFEELGAFVVSADHLAHEALEKGNEPFEKLRILFREALDESGRGFDRRKLGRIVFANTEKRKKLEALVHPYVFKRIAEEIADAEERVLVLEIPLLFETGYDRYCFPNLVVKASGKEIAKRLKEKGYSEKDVRQRLAVQMPLEEKMKRADYVIDNTGSLKKTKEQVKQIWTQIDLALKGANKTYAKGKNESISKK